jgi:hypothetical protein
MFFHRLRGTLVSVALAGTLVLGACGGSDGDSSSDTTADTAGQTTDSTPVDEAARLEAFCSSASDEGINASNLEDDAQVEEVAAQMTARAEALNELAATAPSEVAADVTAVADAATAMAESLASDPTLANFNEVVQQYATPELESASQKIDDFVATNCEG